MTEREKQRLDELELKAAYLMARQDEQDTRMNQIMARLTYLEACQYRILRELGIEPDKLDTPRTAQADAKAISLTILSEHRLN